MFTCVTVYNEAAGHALCVTDIPAQLVRREGERVFIDSCPPMEITPKYVFVGDGALPGRLVPRQPVPLHTLLDIYARHADRVRCCESLVHDPHTNALWLCFATWIDD